jgi:SOUL heme-binding protein
MMWRLLLIFTSLIASFPLNAMATEEPKYVLLEQSGDFQLRQYPSVIIAEVEVEGDMDQATSRGFRLVADYIFGNNRASAGNSEKIAMTTPVTIEPRSEKIAMTVPVTLQPQAGSWRLNFVMPRQFTLDTLPTPNNPKVVLREVPSRKVAVLTFSGLAGESKTAGKVKELLAWMAGKQLEPVANYELARYNAPWTLPFLRRNEVIVEYQ